MATSLYRHRGVVRRRTRIGRELRGGDARETVALWINSPTGRQPFSTPASAQPHFSLRFLTHTQTGVADRTDWMRCKKKQKLVRRIWLGYSVTCLPKLPHHGTSDQVIKKRDKKNDRKTNRRNKLLVPAERLPLAAPIEKQRAECDRNTLQRGDDIVYR